MGDIYKHAWALHGAGAFVSLSGRTTVLTKDGPSDDFVHGQGATTKLDEDQLGEAEHSTGAGQVVAKQRAKEAAGVGVAKRGTHCLGKLLGKGAVAVGTPPRLAHDNIADVDEGAFDGGDLKTLHIAEQAGRKKGRFWVGVMASTENTRGFCGNGVHASQPLGSIPRF